MNDKVLMVVESLKTYCKKYYFAAASPTPTFQFCGIKLNIIPIYSTHLTAIYSNRQDKWFGAS
jgi:hypothetical protein